MRVSGAKPLQRLLGSTVALSLLLSIGEPCSAAVAKSLGASAGAAQRPSPAAIVASLELFLSAPALSVSQASLPAALQPVVLPNMDIVKMEAPRAAAPRRGASAGIQRKETVQDIRGFAHAIAPTLKSISEPRASAGDLFKDGIRLEAALEGSAWRDRPALDPAPQAKSIMQRPFLARLFRPGAALEPGLRSVSREPASVPAEPVAFGVAALAGLGLPLNVWAQMLPWAAAMAVLSGLLFLDVLRGGKISYGLRQFAQRRIKGSAAEPVLEREIYGLFDFSPRSRERDYDELKAFLAEWRQAADSDKEKIWIPRAADNPDLWAQKLAAAYLIESSPSISESIAAALRDSRLRSFEPLERVIAKLADKRGESPFLRRIDISARLADLARRLDPEGDTARKLAREVAQGPSAQSPRARRVWSAIFAVMFALSLALSAVSGYYTPRYHASQASAAQGMRANFWGEDDFIFRDEYIDPRIAQNLKLLEDWYKLDSSKAAELREFIAVLRSSSDPRADTVLEAIFNRGEHLPLTPESDGELLAALVEHGRGAIWDHMREKVEQGGATPKMMERFARMMDAAARSGNEDLFQQVFYFVKSKNDALRAAAVQAVKASLEDPARWNERWQRLAALSEHYVDDFRLQLEVELRMFDFLNRPGEKLADSAQGAAVYNTLNRVLAAAQAFDAERAKVVAKLPPGAQPPGSAVEMMSELLEYALSQGREQGLMTAARYQINQLARRLAEEGVAAAPGLRQRLIETRVTTIKGSVRSSYGLEQLRRFRSALDEEAQRIKDDPAQDTPEKRDYFQRAGRMLDRLIVLAEKAEMPNGGDAAQMAAEDVSEILKAIGNFNGYYGYGPYPYPGYPSPYPPDPNSLSGMLLQQGLVSANGEPLPAYTIEQIRRLQKFLYGKAEEGAWPAPTGVYGMPWSRSLSPYEVQQLIDAAESLDEVARLYYAGQENEQSLKASETPGRLMSRLEDSDPAVREHADKRLRELLRNPNVILAYVNYASAHGAQNPQCLEWALNFLMDKAAESVSSFSDKNLLRSAWAGVARKLIDLGRGAEVAACLERGFAAARAGQAPDLENDFLRPLVQDYIPQAMAGLISRATGAYPGLEARLLKAGVLPSPSFAVAPAVVAPEYFTIYRRRQVEALLELVRQEAAEAGKAAAGLTAAQKRALDGVEEGIPLLLRFADASGMPRGDSAGDISADRLNAVLYEGYRVFYGREFVIELHNHGLAPRSEPYSVTRDKSFFTTYSEEQVRQILELYQDLLAQGQGWDDDKHNTRPLTLEERAYLVEAVRRIQGILADYAK